MIVTLRQSTEPAAMAGVAAIAIAVVGVPHGGLDHWVGRRKLEPRLGWLWMPTFFDVYFFVAALWRALPTPIIIAFFFISAWHFGREESSHEHVG